MPIGYNQSVIPYHLQVTSFGDWGFNLAFNGNNQMKNLTIDTKYLNSGNIASLFGFGNDEYYDNFIMFLGTMQKNAYKHKSVAK